MTALPFTGCMAHNLRRAASGCPTCSFIADLEHDRDDARRGAAKPLDTVRTSSCGHAWTLRHTACPTCFAEMRTALAAAERERYEAREAAGNLSEAVLMFHSAEMWTDAKSERWRYLTGVHDATTRVLCDFARAVVAHVSASTPSPGRERCPLPLCCLPSGHAPGHYTCERCRERFASPDRAPEATMETWPCAMCGEPIPHGPGAWHLSCPSPPSAPQPETPEREFLRSLAYCIDEAGEMRDRIRQHLHAPQPEAEGTRSDPLRTYVRGSAIVMLGSTADDLHALGHRGMERDIRECADLLKRLSASPAPAPDDAKEG